MTNANDNGVQAQQSRTVSLPLLERVQIASPCPVRWEDMAGDHVSRHCSQCDLDVYDISSMTRIEAEAFLQERFGACGESGDRRVCLQLFRRSDGTILTSDCPVGLAAVRQRVRLVAARIAAALGLTMLLGVTVESPAVPQVRCTEPFPRLIDAVWMISAKLGLSKVLPPPPARRGGVIRGGACIPPTPNPTRDVAMSEPTDGRIQ